MLGTFILVFLGNSSVAQKILQNANYLDINLAYGLVLFIKSNRQGANSDDFKSGICNIMV